MIQLNKTVADACIYTEQINTEETLCHIIILGQSLSMGYATKECLKPVSRKNTYMFKQVRTQDFGYVFGITKEEYGKNSEKYEKDFYSELKPLCESGGNGKAAMCWESASPDEYETPASGIAYGLSDAYRRNGFAEIPYKILLSAPGIGGTDIREYGAGTKIYERTKRDIENGKRLADKAGLRYKVSAFVWMQGENNYSDTAEFYYSELIKIMKTYRELVKSEIVGVPEIPFISYQTMGQNSYYPTVTQAPALAQFNAAENDDNLFYLSAPCYQFQAYEDKVHITNISSRNIGVLLGNALYDVLNGEYRLFKPEYEIYGEKAILKFPFNIRLDLSGAQGSADKIKISSNGGFFCYDSDGKLMNPILMLCDDKRTLYVNCGKKISKMIYGFDFSENGGRQYTYGGIVRTERDFDVCGNAIGCYMPVQIIF